MSVTAIAIVAALAIYAVIIGLGVGLAIIFERFTRLK